MLQKVVYRPLGTLYLSGWWNRYQVTEKEDMRIFLVFEKEAVTSCLGYIYLHSHTLTCRGVVLKQITYENTGDTDHSQFS